MLKDCSRIVAASFTNKAQNYVLLQSFCGNEGNLEAKVMGH